MQILHLATTIKTLCKKRNIAISTLIADCSLTKSIIYDLEKRDKTPSVDKIESDIVLVKCQPALENGEIGIFTLNEKGYIKKFHIDDKGNRTLVSLNADYLPIPVNSNDEVRVVGKVLCTL